MNESKVYQKMYGEVIFINVCLDDPCLKYDEGFVVVPTIVMNEKPKSLITLRSLLNASPVADPEICPRGARLLAKLAKLVLTGQGGPGLRAPWIRYCAPLCFPPHAVIRTAHRDVISTQTLLTDH